MKRFIFSVMIVIMFCFNGYSGEDTGKVTISKYMYNDHLIKCFNTINKHNEKCNSEKYFLKSFDKFNEDVEKERMSLIKNIEKEIDRKTKKGDFEAVNVLKTNLKLLTTGLYNNKEVDLPFVFNGLSNYPIDVKFINMSKTFQNNLNNYEKSIQKVCKKYISEINKCINKESKKNGHVSLIECYSKEIITIKSLTQFYPVGNWRHNKVTMKFNHDGSMEVSFMKNTTKGKWEVDVKNNKLIIVYENRKKHTYDIVSRIKITRKYNNQNNDTYVREK